MTQSHYVVSVTAIPPFRDNFRSAVIIVTAHSKDDALTMTEPFRHGLRGEIVATATRI